MMEKSILFYLFRKISEFVKELQIEILTQPLKSGVRHHILFFFLFPFSLCLSFCLLPSAFCLVLEVLDLSYQLLNAVFCMAKEHPGVVVEKQEVFDGCVAFAHAAFHHDNTFGFPNPYDRHAVNRT